MPHFGDSSVFQQHLHDIESNWYRRGADSTQVLQSRLGNQAPFPRVHSCGRSDPSFGRPRLNLHKDQAITITKDEVNLAACSRVVGHKKLEAKPLQMSARGRFPQLPVV
jgi:hypothetical protein